MKAKLAMLSVKPRLYVSVFFLCYLAMGIALYKDYGVSWDEPTHRQIALVNAKYLASLFLPAFHPAEFAALPSLADYSSKQYGIVFDLPVYLAETWFGYNGNMPEAYYLRHLCTFLLFYVSVIFFYLIVRNRFDSRLLGLAGCLLLILSPRFFAESFYSKDVVFLSLFIIAIYFFIRYLDRHTIMNAFLFGLASALVLDQRITGVFIPCLAAGMTGLDIIKMERPWRSLPGKLRPLFIYLLSLVFFTILFWPYLWEHPLDSFINAFGRMNKFPFSPPVLYLGAFIKATELPWHYVPLWMLITTPLTHIFFFLIGCFGISKGIIKNGLKFYENARERQDFLFLLLLLAPLAAVIFLKSVLYDGWRHLYFIYAPFLLIAITGVAKVLRSMQEVKTGRERCAAVFIAVMVGWGFIATAYQIIRDHPFQNVYFNCLAGNNVAENFELDYWGLSFRRGLEYVVKNDGRPVIKLAANTAPPLINNAVFVGKKDLRRLHLADLAEADYFLTNYRWHPQPYGFAKEVYNVTVDNMKIMSVFKLR